MLYRSESGDPILLFVSNDLGTVPTDTSELLLTDSHPDTLSWYPIPFTHRRGTTASAATSAGRVPPAPS